jgi:hypothetical protein
MPTENLVSIFQFSTGYDYMAIITPVSCCRFWWEAGYGGHLQQLRLKRGDQKKVYVMKDLVLGVTVQQNLIHMELPLC